MCFSVLLITKFTLKGIVHKNIYSSILERFPAKFSTKFILIYISKINFRVLESSVKQSTCRNFGDEQLINASVLYNKPLMFW
jgi:hypothetical protein